MLALPTSPSSSSILQGAIQDLVRELSCAICLGLLEEPVVTPCRHIFCGACIRRSLRPRMNDDSQQLATRPQTSHWCPLCKAKCLPRALVECDAVFVRIVDRVRSVGAAFQHDFGFACSQLPNATPKSPMRTMPIICEAEAVETIPHIDEDDDVDQGQMPTLMDLPSTPDDLFVMPHCRQETKRPDLTRTDDLPSTCMNEPDDLDQRVEIADRREASKPTPSPRHRPSAPQDGMPTRAARMPTETVSKPLLTLKGKECRQGSTSQTSIGKSQMHGTPRTQCGEAKIQRTAASLSLEECPNLQGIATSNVAPEDLPMLERFAARFNCPIVPHISDQVSHLVVTPVARQRRASTSKMSPSMFKSPPHPGEGDQSLLAKRTFKYLQAQFFVPRGLRILSAEWARECLWQDRLVPDGDYVILGDPEVRRVAIEEQEEEGGDMAILFSSFNFFLYGDFDGTLRADLATLIALGGGHVVADVSLLTRRRSLPATRVLCDERVQSSFERDAHVLRHHRPFLSAKWLLDCVSAGRLLPPDPYEVL
jgi:hypothetical protein